MPNGVTTLAAGDRVGNYPILGLVGAGGMGVVYRALDVKLERLVALKFLPDDVAATERDKERFLREARAASSLGHPNIGVIHGIEETSDGRTYIVMAFYEGETLARRIWRGPLPLGEAVDIAIQIARGLAGAHSRGVIHRDIKPGNIILTQTNVAKIVDFGLARANTSTRTTQTLGTVGTVGYMSPEQTMSKPVDQRTDLWALGIVLAEMITGRGPFHRRGDDVRDSERSSANPPGNRAGAFAHYLSRTRQRCCRPVPQRERNAGGPRGLSRTSTAGLRPRAHQPGCRERCRAA